MKKKYRLYYENIPGRHTLTLIDPAIAWVAARAIALEKGGFVTLTGEKGSAEFFADGSSKVYWNFGETISYGPSTIAAI